MNRAASQLGKKAKGVPKTITKAERERRRKSLAEARKKRWPQNPKVGRAAGAGGVDENATPKEATDNE